MNDWRIIVAVGIITLLAWSLFEGRLISAIRLRRLKKQGRCITATEAIDEYEKGLGLLVQNKSLLPGNWWFLRNSDRPDDYDLRTAMGKFGYVVVCISARDRKTLKKYRGKVEELLEPFDQ